jgi:hypothetical protein
MFASVGEGLRLVGEGVNFLSQRISCLAGSLAPNYNQKFTKYEMMLASVNLKLHNEDSANLKDGIGAQELGKMAQLLESQITDDILQYASGREGQFRKLQVLLKLIESREPNLNLFLKPLEEDATKAEQRARQFNEFIEQPDQLSFLKALEPTHNRAVIEGSTARESLELANEIQALLYCLFETLACKSSRCGDDAAHHVAKLQLLSSKLHSNFTENCFSCRVFLCSRSDQEPETWHEVNSSFTP